MNDSQIIVITPIRNESWVLEAFLECVTSWADKVIIMDQHSDDGSQEIAKRYKKVILIDNPLTEMNQANTRYLLFKEVDKIEGDKIVFALDADEFLSKGFQHTKGWGRILESTPNTIFLFRWINVYGDMEHVLDEHNSFMEWGCHFSENTSIAELYRNCESRAIHESRIPCIVDADYVNIDDIQFVHLARLNLVRTRNKNDFYQVSTISKLPKRISAVSIYRQYHQLDYPQLKQINIDIETKDGIDVKSMIKINDKGQYYIDEMRMILEREGLSKYYKLDIWDNPDLNMFNVSNNKPIWITLLHWYLEHTQRKKDILIIKFIDKCLKYII